MRTASASVILVAIWAGSSLAATQGQTLGRTVTPRFSRPQVVADTNPRPTIAGRFDCSDDGTIYVFVDGYTPNADHPSATERLALLGIHPDGSVTNFDWHSIDGYTHVYLPRSVFVGYGRVYVLAKAEREVVGGKRSPGFVALIFNSDGVLVRTTSLERWIEPWVLGAFKSGNMILLSEDRLNHRIDLDLLAPDGSAIRQLHLGSEDYLTLASMMPTGPGKYESDFLVASSTFHPFGDRLLLTPTVLSGLPILELSEQGVVKAMVPKVPEGTVIDQFISSTPTTAQLRLGTVIQSHPEINSGGKWMGMGITPSQQITEFSLADGSILHQMNFGSSNLQPACEADGALRLLTSSGSSGFLSVTTESMR